MYGSSGFLGTYLANVSQNCPSGSSGGRLATSKSTLNTNLTLTVLGDPTQSEVISVSVAGAAGQTGWLQAWDSTGMLVAQQAMNPTGNMEPQTLYLGNKPGGYFLRASSDTGISNIVWLIRR